MEKEGSEFSHRFPSGTPRVSFRGRRREPPRCPGATQVLKPRPRVQRKNRCALLHLTVTQLARLIRRICTQRSGLRENDTFRIAQALLIRGIAYDTLLVKLKAQEQNTIITVIRKANKVAIGLQALTPTDRLLKLRLHQPHTFTASRRAESRSSTTAITHPHVAGGTNQTGRTVPTVY